MLSSKKKFKSGKIKRHRLRKAMGVKSGFGKPWSAPSVTFRVEFSWSNLDGSESNEQVHWIECRKFQGQEREFLKSHYAQSAENWTEGETLESKFVCVYCAQFLVEQRKQAQLYWDSSILAGSKGLEIPGIDQFIWDLPSFDGEPPSDMMTAIAPDEASEKVKQFPVVYFPLPSAFLLSQAFIFPTSKQGNETIRMPIYQIKWTEELASNSVFDQNIAIVLKNSIWHTH